MKISQKKALWSGRFSTGAHEAVWELSQSVSYDKRLYAQDIRGSIAHAKMLRRVGIITAQERDLILKGLKDIQSEIEQKKFRWNIAHEDVHMNIESALTKKTPAGAKLHTGRSRNDQVAVDIRLWLKEQIEQHLYEVRELQCALVALANENDDVIIPGYTHLQRAQPVYLAHHLLAYVEMLERDAQRLADVYKRTDVCPLGAGAIAGSSLPLDREFVAKELGFSKVTQNSMDAVSDRDFLIEYNSAAALIAVHLSRLGEDLILWSSAEFGFIRIGDAFTTGSSLMPQKKNPDVAELIRGKSARVIGNLTALLTLMKGLPMTYNRDLQEDKERVFDTADTIHLCLHTTALMLRDVRIMSQRCEAAAFDPLLLATDAADTLVRAGIPFRRAHEIVGGAVALAETRGVPIHKLTLKDWKCIDSAVPHEVIGAFDLRTALEHRTMTGAPSRKQIQKQLSRWKKHFDKGFSLHE
ncbi:MAG: argininosuccinate lyase [Verrucomicrobiota bacterium]